MNMVREMIGGCCVCLDERGWNENPLVYCDGGGCNVAVHQACYGIVEVPSGPWYCCKCCSTERIARVKCELCPMKEGALKRTDTGGWAHVVCALYIPEVRFGNVSTMEPIIFSSVPHERFIKPCYICDESGRESKTSSGACMGCHKTGCKLAFHVTCAQRKRLLCEEASVNGHVQYVGFCKLHWAKRFKAPTSGTITEQDVNRSLKDKKSRSRTESMSSVNSTEIGSKVKKKITRPPDINNAQLNKHSCVDVTSPAQGESSMLFDEDRIHSNITHKKTAIPLSHAKIKDSASFSVNGLLSDSKLKISSPLNTPVLKDETKSKEIVSSSDEKQGSSTIVKNKDFANKKRKLKEKEKEKCHKKKVKLKAEKECKPKEIAANYKKNDQLDKRKVQKDKVKNTVTENKKTKKIPQPSKLGLVENGKLSSWESVIPKSVQTPDNFQDFLEHQWNQSAQFILSKAEHFDVASLLTTLHQLKGDNAQLEKKLTHLQSRRDRLLGVNARLAASFGESAKKVEQEYNNNSNPLSAMLNKLNDNASPNNLNSCKKTEDKIMASENCAVSSPDLAMLAAASANLEGNLRSSLESQASVPDEKPAINNLGASSLLMQPSLLSHRHRVLSSSATSLLDVVRDDVFHNKPLYNGMDDERMCMNDSSTDSSDETSSNL